MKNMVNAALVAALSVAGTACSEDTTSGGGTQRTSRTDAGRGEVDTGRPDLGDAEVDLGMGREDMGREDAGTPPPEAAVVYTQGGRQERCEDRTIYRRAYFGDLHVHTSYSFDAYSHETRNDPFVAYDFARGEKVCVGDLGTTGGAARGRVPIQLREPLDFTGVTDHAELLGEVELCTDPDSNIYNTASCRSMRNRGQQGVALFAASFFRNDPDRIPIACRIGDANDPDNPCVVAAREPWSNILSAADQANDFGSSCSFVSFPAYEWTGSPLGATLHRNVIFRNDEVLDSPISYFDETEPEQLRQQLDDSCTDAGGRCQVLTIPHNSNASQGNAFEIEYDPDMTMSELEEAAKRRARLEPLMEIFQHKGASECYYKEDQPLRRFSDDPSCEFELLGDVSFENPVIPLPFPRDYLRGALGLGLRETQSGRTNPLKLGIIASTDTHNGTPGATDERDFRGHLGSTERDNVDRSDAADGTNPGGLVGIWSVERSRDALFEGMQRRETFGTSGTRIQPRFFAGWEIPEDACESARMLDMVYVDGIAVPMGSTLPAGKEGRAPMFIVQATKHEMPLANTEIVKIWVDADGQTRETILNVAGARDNGSSADPETCEVEDPGDRGMANTCEVFTDPEFDPDLPAAYYMRAFENPSCRYDRWRCVQQREQRGNPLADDPMCGEPILAPEYDSPEDDLCSTVRPGSIQQERAWTSPIWYEP